MRQIPVDTSQMTVMLIQQPEKKVKNRETGEIARDRTTDQALFNVNVAVIVDSKPDAVTIVVPEDGIAEGLVPGMPVALPGLVARPWENNNGHGISYRAVGVMANVPVVASSSKG